MLHISDAKGLDPRQLLRIPLAHRWSDPSLAGKPPQGVKKGANRNKACFKQASLLLALPFYGRAGFWAFDKAICYQCWGVSPLIRQQHPLRSRGSCIHEWFKNAVKNCKPNHITHIRLPSKPLFVQPPLYKISDISSISKYSEITLNWNVSFRIVYMKYGSTFSSAFLPQQCLNFAANLALPFFYRLPSC